MASDKSELRQLAPDHLLQALDAIAMANGMDRKLAESVGGAAE